MKDKIHPQYYTNAKVACACGNAWETGSTQKEIQVEICSKCHPFYTGKQKLLDTARRVEKFEERMAKKTVTAKTRKGKKIKQATRASKRKSISEKKDKETEKQRNKEIKGAKKVNKSDKVNPPALLGTGKMVNGSDKPTTSKVNTAVNSPADRADKTNNKPGKQTGK
ncbi:50S ribosomal protein L31 [Patescibacteria group bacterium]|nr:50S ribosomal protein L31 [Patescibacteria group bacterium]MBU4512425.1 50S ribosomal protein L31 [Patescibacteria group bacterium]